ncbi:LysR family transcriptional regulator [Kitasatospora sp. NPDC052896]|uniref:LysR family transcriptional regulator n=1 Tax=Kitasatospora sp. NPDC052896 TaxID=3364061 RepID=UPI0037CB041F
MRELLVVCCSRRRRAAHLKDRPPRRGASKTSSASCHTSPVWGGEAEPTDLDQRRIRHFMARAEQLNFGRATQLPRIVLSVLSRQIHSPAGELSDQLLVHDRHGTRLTPAGERLPRPAGAVPGWPAPGRTQGCSSCLRSPATRSSSTPSCSAA